MTSIKNRHFFFVYEPKKDLGYNKRRFAVSKNKLASYIGVKNSNKVLLEAIDLAEDSIRIKFRKYGIIDIYQK